MHLTSRIVAFLVLAQIASAQEPVKDVFIPRRQDVMPGPALSPTEAIKKMVVPEGFKVELVAAEPDVVNPVAMTFDERGRVWITESFEYPRREPGPGRDRVKTLEDTDGDGTLDKVTIFAEGLNIPSGIAVGYGGVWVANSPDILFMQDTDGDGKADKQEVVVTGFGRDDTHELPNSLTWGPDGWLYGLNGVFNPSKIVHQGKTHNFTCAMFRIHPRTRAFEVFCEGTSNPWGIAIDKEGSFFVSACVIDHLWHLVETGYYHRQGGPYPPYTWKIESIVKHKHQLAAYCGIHYYDSDAYPAEYREKLYMGNVHGNCINSDRLERDGSTYRGLPEPDFLKANDAWFMPVVQKTGPDGCLWILDWYDRYHCYQDANRDPAGIDRGHGRLYRVRYQDTPRAPKFDLSKETDEQLIERLKSPNGFFRDIAQRVLAERSTPTTLAKLKTLVLNEALPAKERMHYFWALISAERTQIVPLLDAAFFAKASQWFEPSLRAWAVRAVRIVGGRHVWQPAELKLFGASHFRNDPSVQVQLERVICNAVETNECFDLLERYPSDLHLARLIWARLKRNQMSPDGRFQPADEQVILNSLETNDLDEHAALRELTPRLIDFMANTARASSLVESLAQSENLKATTIAHSLDAIARRVVSGEITLRLNDRVFNDFFSAKASKEVYFSAALLGAVASHPDALRYLESVARDPRETITRRVRAFEALVIGKDERYLKIAREYLVDGSVPLDLNRGVILGLSRSSLLDTGGLLIDVYGHLAPELQPLVIELFTQRPQWVPEFLGAIERKEIATTDVNVNQVAALARIKNPKIAERISAIWGTVRTERNPQREQVVAQMRELLQKHSGDPHKGVAAFHRLCGQCHKIHGQGQDVGPDITVNGRASIDQLLSNVFDPSLVIGKIYQAYTVVTTDGRTLTGLVVEDNPQRVVLKVQGGKIETIARKDIDEIALSKLSLMPEGVEKQLSPEELRDLLAFLVLDKPPSDPAARMIPDVKK
jgi:putative membrane-bound dehydrogenase-like protein